MSAHIVVCALDLLRESGLVIEEKSLVGGEEVDPAK